jgi:hypothetical protein
VPGQKIDSVRETANQSCVAKRLAALKSPTQPSLKLIEMATEIQGNELGNLGFFARFLIQCTLPHTDPGDIPAWTRKNGAYTLVVQPGWDLDNNRALGYPYGSIPRLLLIWIITEAKRTNSRRLELTYSLDAFLRAMNLNPKSGGGKRSDAKRMKEQATRLFGAHIAFHRRYEEMNFQTGAATGRGYDHVLKAEVASETMLWWDCKTDKLAEPVESNVVVCEEEKEDQLSWIELSTHFFDAIMRSVVPCDMRAIGLLQRSPLAIDLYMLCNWIGANMKNKSSHLVTWKMLMDQLGCDYTDQANAKKKIKAAMRKVQLAHPKLKFRYPPKGGGIEILASPPAIARTQPQRDRA